MRIVLFALLLATLGIAEAQPSVDILNGDSPLRFTAYYRPPGATPGAKDWGRWVRWGDECISPLPPADWRAAEYNDIGWPRATGEVYGGYGYAYKADVTLLCVRARFGVTDTTRVEDLPLALTYRGGAIVYLNGVEVARKHLPDGAVEPYAPAEDYPAEQYDLGDPGRVAADAAKYAARYRTLETVLPARLLRKGVNVLALEIHRAAPADTPFKGCKWNMAGLVSLKLSSPAGAPVTPNTGTKDMRMWSADPALRVGVDARYGDLLEPASFELQAPVNGLSSAVVVISGPEAIPAMAARTSELTGPAGVIPASAMQVRFARISGDTVGLYDRMPTGDDAQRPPWRQPDPRTPIARPDGPRFLPVWVSIKVPPTAEAGVYTGILTLGGDKTRAIPITLRVFGWTVADPQGWQTWVNMLTSPESVAGVYKVPLWSDEHFRLLEPSLKLLGEAGNDLISINAVANTPFGNDPVIVFRKEGDAFVPDFRYLEKYLALYDRCVGTPKYLSVHIWQYGMSTNGRTRDGGPTETIAKTIPVMVLQDGKLVNVEAPMYGQPGTAATWKATMDGIRERVEKIGWTKTKLLIGTGGDNWPNPPIVTFFQEVAPWAQWRVITHGGGAPKWGPTDADRTQPNGMVVAWLELARRIAFIRDRYPDVPRTVNARDCLGTDPFGWRSMCPASIVNARYDGVAWKRLDYWGYVMPNGMMRSPLGAYCGFGNVMGNQPSCTIPGPDGALATQQYENFRLGIQDSEAIWFIRRALADVAMKAKLSPDLLARATAIQDTVSDVYEIGLRTGPHGGADLRSLTIQLHGIAEEVAAATGQ